LAIGEECSRLTWRRRRRGGLGPRRRRSSSQRRMIRLARRGVSVSVRGRRNRAVRSGRLHLGRPLLYRWSRSSQGLNCKKRKYPSSPARPPLFFFGTVSVPPPFSRNLTNNIYKKNSQIFFRFYFIYIYFFDSTSSIYKILRLNLL
jgi:hypothetical protein